MCLAQKKCFFISQFLSCFPSYAPLLLSLSIYLLIYVSICQMSFIQINYKIFKKQAWLRRFPSPSIVTSLLDFFLYISKIAQYLEEKSVTFQRVTRIF